jgi:hypothetical protein
MAKNDNKGKEMKPVKDKQDKQVKWVVREQADGTAKLSIQNAGRAGKLFLCNKDASLVEVLNAESFKAAWQDKAVSKTGKTTGGRFISAHVKVAGEQADEVKKDVFANLGGVVRLIQNGGLKGSGRKIKVEVIPLA